jgi:hypothetical protein
VTAAVHRVSTDHILIIIIIIIIVYTDDKLQRQRGATLTIYLVGGRHSRRGIDSMDMR